MLCSGFEMAIEINDHGNATPGRLTRVMAHCSETSFSSA
jgi:hypothetical protein